MSIISAAPFPRRSVEARRLGIRFAAALAVLVLLGAAAPASKAAEWSPPVHLRSFPGVYPYDVARPQVGVDADGDAVFVWTSRDSTSDCYSGCMRVQARVRSADGALSPVETLSPPGLNASGAELAVAPSGAAVVTWEVADTCSGHPCLVGQVRTRSPAGELGAIETIARDDPFQGGATVAIDAAGNAPIVWLGSDGRVRTRTLTAAGVFGGIRALSLAGRFATDPQVAIKSGGGVVFAWVIHAARGGRHGRVQSRAIGLTGK
jgi:hypothetical protein